MGEYSARANREQRRYISALTQLIREANRELNRAQIGADPSEHHGLSLAWTEVLSRRVQVITTLRQS